MNTDADATTRVQAADLAGPALTWAVATCVGDNPTIDFHARGVPMIRSGRRLCDYVEDWASAGPIIAREKIQLRGIDAPGHAWDGKWLAQYGKFRPTSTQVDWHPHDRFSSAALDTGYYEGPTPLIAAMRCFVASKLGDAIDLPADLL